MSGEGGGSSSGIDSNLISIHYPVSCVNCYLNYGDFCAVYSQQIEKLVGLAQNHGLILKEKTCPTCGELCRSIKVCSYQ